MRAVGAKVAVGVIVADMVDVYFPAHLHGNGYWHYPPGLMLRYFYIKQAASRPSEQARDARLALLLRLQRDNSLVVVYLGRCPRLYTSAPSARVGHAGLRVAHVVLPTVSWSLPLAISLGLRDALSVCVAHSVVVVRVIGNVKNGMKNRGERPSYFSVSYLPPWQP